MILSSAAFDEEQYPGDDSREAHRGRGGQSRDGDFNQRFHGKPSMFVFHDFGDVNAVVAGFWQRLFGLFNIIFINFEFLDAGVFPDVVLELRFKAKGEGGVDSGVLQFESTGVGNLVHGNSFMKLPELVRDVWAAQRNVLIMDGINQEVVVVQL